MKKSGVRLRILVVFRMKCSPYLLFINHLFTTFSDTVGRSGVFCAASNAIEQCKTEGLVDVFQATKAVRMNKPEAVTSIVSFSS